MGDGTSARVILVSGTRGTDELKEGTMELFENRETAGQVSLGRIQGRGLRESVRT